MAAILNSAILNLAILDSGILVFPLKLTHTCQDSFPLFPQKNLDSFILTHLDDGSHIEFWHIGFSHLHKKNVTQSFSLNLMMAAILNSAITDSAIFHKKTSFIHSDSSWWWQPSWIQPCWIQTLPSWIQTPSFLPSHSLKNTLTPFWLWLKLIQSDSNSFILI